MSKKRKIILVTDGDNVARRAVEVAAKNIGGRCISRSGGNPTPITGEKIVDFIKQAKYDPVVIMVDDVGDEGFGKGEKALNEILLCDDVEILGIVAVASNTKDVNGIKVDFSVTADGKVVKKAVDKDGVETDDNILYGDTVDIINSYNIPLVVGIGDIGKMNGKDDISKGAPIVTKALKEILNRSE
ncbi:stage V sporulation protein AE [Caldisalinibacter kiritimatiensis]|uniref:Stage V sporulation protein AE (SpoVAE) n=1 Tax=Caldisalinibacter kiritimatiensis TaxID=1304284 RepID=R1CS93_9FIRM|nr:stage V sporulation protein AE [Caldisalinibacter kiritimatiensis]EOD01516.1 Stage V sporulation protein AE (SpoVAE) [Caldisalinibacter kiritimatiensis]